MGGFSERVKIRLDDTFRYARLVREASGVRHLLISSFSDNPADALFRAVQAYRFAGSRFLKRRARAKIQRYTNTGSLPFWRDGQVGWKRYRDHLRDKKLTRTVILKTPGAGGEKGVILSTFEYNWLRLLAGVDSAGLRYLDEHFDIIFSTSSSPSSYALLGLALGSLRGTVFVQVCNYEEAPNIEAIDPRIRCVPMLPCDWLEPSLFMPKPVPERQTDILMVAGWAPVKRQWQFFEALSKMPQNLKVVMIGQAEGRYDIGHAKRQARLFGARQNIEFHQSLPIGEVVRHQCDSKISLIFSRREGCCVAVTESFMAGAPVGLIADAHIGPKAYINAETGVLLDRKRDLAGQLMSFLEQSGKYSPRAWAKKEISCHISAKKLNHFLKEHNVKSGRLWTKDIVTPCWHPHPTVAHSERAGELRPCYSDLHQRFPQVFPDNLIDESYR